MILTCFCLLSYFLVYSCYPTTAAPGQSSPSPLKPSWSSPQTLGCRPESYKALLRTFWERKVEPVHSGTS